MLFYHHLLNPSAILLCQPFGLCASVAPLTGGYHHWQRLCQPSGLETTKGFPRQKATTGVCSSPHLNNHLPHTFTQHIHSMRAVQIMDRGTHQFKHAILSTVWRAVATEEPLRSKADRRASVPSISTFHFQLSRAIGSPPCPASIRRKKSSLH